MEYKIREATPEEVADIIINREPRGLFWQRDGDIFVGIDNSTGEAWTEDFDTLERCLAWLERKEEKDDEQ